MIQVDGLVHVARDAHSYTGVGVLVTLQDVSRADAAAVVLARTEVVLDGTAYVPFHLECDADIDPRARLAVRARADVEGRLVLTSTEVVPVAPEGAHEVVVTVHPVPGRPPAAGDPLDAGA